MRYKYKNNTNTFKVINPFNTLNIFFSALASLFLLYPEITSLNLQPLFYKAFRPVLKNHPLLQKCLTNCSKLTAKPIDYILFQPAESDFWLPCNPGDYVTYQDTLVSDFLKFVQIPLCFLKAPGIMHIKPTSSRPIL